MANRTLQFYGKGYGSSPAEITVKLDNEIVFDGAVPTADQIEVDHSPDAQVVLFTCEVPVLFEGKMPMSVTVNTGTVVFAEVKGNHCYSGDNLAGFFHIFNNDVRSSVKIDDVDQTTLWETTGTWSWLVNAGSTLTYDLNINTGVEQ